MNGPDWEAIKRRPILVNCAVRSACSVVVICCRHFESWWSLERVGWVVVAVIARGMAVIVVIARRAAVTVVLTRGMAVVIARVRGPVVVPVPRRGSRDGVVIGLPVLITAVLAR